ncbi:hypothetical protein ES708_30357 [subsurface metagenome]
MVAGQGLGGPRFPGYNHKGAPLNVPQIERIAADFLKGPAMFIDFALLKTIIKILRKVLEMLDRMLDDENHTQLVNKANGRNPKSS